MLSSEIEALVWFVKRDLLDEGAVAMEGLRPLPEVEAILKKQRDDGSWKYPGRRSHGFEGENYDLLQTWRMLGILVEQYALRKPHPSILAAAEYLFSHQTEEGDIRGVFGRQYATHYAAGMMEWLLLHYDDSWVISGFE